MVDLRSTEDILKAHKNWVYVRTDRNGTRYFHNYTCTRCGGRGGWEGWPGYTCYECGGSGVSDKPELYKVYTPEHEEKLRLQREARAKKRQAEREAKALAEREQNLANAGFGKEDDVFVIYRVKGNTFSIKDQLKELGCKFKPGIGWFAPHALEGYDCQRMEESQVLCNYPYVQWKEKNELEDLCEKEVSPSTWQGEIGERLEIELHIDRQIEGIGYGGRRSYLYLMSDSNKNVYKWSSSCWYQEGEDVHFRATVKDHTEYNGTQQTVLTRCTLVKGA